MLKVKRMADGVIFGFNGYDVPPANKKGFTVFDDSKAEPETLNIDLVEEKIEPVFPTAKPKVGLGEIETKDEEEKPAEVPKPKGGPSEESVSKYKVAIKELRALKTRANIRDYVKEAFGFTISKINRKHVEVLKEAENIAYRNLKEK